MAAVHRSYPKKAGFRLGIYVCKDAEIVDFAAPHGVFSVARRYDPELDAWRILWSDPATNFFTQQIARQQGQDNRPTGPDPRGGSMR